MTARDPMAPWHTCPRHKTPFRDGEDCPDCASSHALYGTRWAIAGGRNGWTMPAAPRWKRLPVIRHVRVMYHAARLVIWEDFWIRAGYVPNGYDDWVLAGMWRGWEARPHG